MGGSGANSFVEFTKASTAPSLSLQMQGKMMAYDRVVTELNNARLRGTSYPVVHALIDASLAVASDVCPQPLSFTNFANVLQLVDSPAPCR